MTRYTIDISAYSDTAQVKTECNSFQVINYGDVPLIINKQVTLQQNQTFTIEGNEMEFTTAVLSFTFGTTGTIKNAVIVRKIFVI